MYEWRNTDPRIDIYKRADIIIIRPDGTLCKAQVATKHVYCVFTNFSDNRCIGEGKDWDPDWKWIYGPHFGKYDWDPWKNSDPRFDVKDNKNIVIVAPWFGAGSGIVNNENGWSITSPFEGHETLTVDDEWSQDWWWIYGP
jgi:hypothetical protein